MIHSLQFPSMLQTALVSSNVERRRLSQPDTGFALSESESLKWPGLVKFDNVNGKFDEKILVKQENENLQILDDFISKKRRLVAELEALEEQGDAARSLEHMREIVARDSVTLGNLEQLLARAQVGAGLKAGYVADIEAKE
ncbi:hypothetical protein Tco_1254490 [Tanacetum coccineum]